MRKIKIVLRVLFPASLVLLFTLFIGWMFAFSVFALGRYLSNNKVTATVLIWSAIPLLPCYLISWLNLQILMKNEALDDQEEEMGKVIPLRPKWRRFGRW